MRMFEVISTPARDFGSPSYRTENSSVHSAQQYRFHLISKCVIVTRRHPVSLQKEGLCRLNAFVFVRPHLLGEPVRLNSRYFVTRQTPDQFGHGTKLGRRRDERNETTTVESR
jgi:hypothetical protein